MSSPTQICLPNPLAQWPWPRKLSEHFGEVKPESDAWLRSFEALDTKSQRSFDLCNFREFLAVHLRFSERLREYTYIALLGSLIYPLLDKGLLVYHRLEPNILTISRWRSSWLRSHASFLHIRRVHGQSR